GLTAVASAACARSSAHSASTAVVPKSRTTTTVARLRISRCYPRRTQRRAGASRTSTLLQPPERTSTSASPLTPLARALTLYLVGVNDFQAAVPSSSVGRGVQELKNP